ncbi:hypothetical protein TRAPUB_2763 [Trametes pubescens]|uniref:Prolyl 4-hydroxylase alpha subunit Fe(2+) 2OG dioxygenase domain-containing protein n=1 Tax=Trametes pubescens TaxID=154538 RepID=A0A1M2VFL0_TRAPU|nr:hypothetical protein TRAPUB_2763 [Trametes pubescens]
MRIMRALKQATRLSAIGDCPTVNSARTAKMRRYDNDDGEGVAASYEYAKVKRSDDEIAKVERNKEYFEQLAALVEADRRDSASGYLEKPFRLRITRPGCEFDGYIAANRTTNYKHSGWEEPYDDKTLREELRQRLRKWHDSALTSGYGDVREQVTKIDESVRTAREIGTSEFAVEDGLLRQIERIWTEQFVPSSDVRAEAYKIHLYGPGGHFKMHRDTPQKDLVGTFLIGLGDTSSWGGLVVNGQAMEARPGSWCAFYPDVPHYVKELSKDGYRASIAFKLFRAPPPLWRRNCESTKTEQVRLRIAEIVAQVEAPFGLLLEHKYSLGTNEFSGFDALMVEAMRSRFSGSGFEVHHIPVVVEEYARWGDEDEEDEFSMMCDTTVYPFTSGHIDFLNEDVSKGDELNGCEWLEGVKNVPFYSVDLSDRTMFPYKKEEVETVNHTGNEAQAWRADSVYLSYALVVLPKVDKDTVEVVGASA